MLYPPIKKFFISTSVLLGLAAFATAEVIVVNGKTPLREPFSMVFDRGGTLYGVEYAHGNRVFAISPEGVFRVIAGAGSNAGKKLGDIAKGDGGPAKGGRFNGMHDLARTPDGRIYIADTFNNRVRLIERGRITTFAGIGGKGGYGGDGGPAAKAIFNGVYTVTLNKDASRLLLADLGNRRLREIDLESNVIRTVAGNGKKGVPKDGALATEAPLLAPRAACYGADGSIYIASREGNALRHVRPDGKIHTVVNASGKKGYGGDGGEGRMAMLNGPKHLSLDPDGNIVIADDGNHCIRLYKPADGTIHLLVGSPGTSGTKIGTGPLDTQLLRPHGARYDHEGHLYVADSFNHRVLKFTK
jgi:DNA-binding beta-propeller fold protein YncE